MARVRRPDTDPTAVLTRLAPVFSRAPIRELGEGWDNVVYAVGDGLVLRISKASDVAERHTAVERDLAILEFATRHSTLPVSDVLAYDADEGALLSTIIYGVGADVCPPARLDRAAEQLGEFFATLHAVAYEGIPPLIGPELQTPAGWLHRATEEYAAVRDRVPPDLTHTIDAFLAEPPAEVGPGRSFLHNDVTAEHIIVDPETREISGVIDWSDAVVTDPVRDLALPAVDFGPDFLDRMLAAYGAPTDDAFHSRLRWVAVRSAIYGLAYRIANDQPGRSDAEAGLRRLLTAW